MYRECMNMLDAWSLLIQHFDLVILWLLYYTWVKKGTWVLRAAKEGEGGATRILHQSSDLETFRMSLFIVH